MEVLGTNKNFAILTFLFQHRMGCFIYNNNVVLIQELDKLLQN